MLWQEAGCNRDIPGTLAQRWAATVLQTSAAFSSQERCYNGLQDLIIRQKSVDELDPRTFSHKGLMRQNGEPFLTERS